VIVVNPPAGHPEYQTSDLRLQITNGAVLVLDQNLDFNVSVVTMNPLSGDPSDYISQDASLYFGLPDPSIGLDPALAHVDLPSDGTPPRYEVVFDAVNLVLAKDPTGTSLTQLANPLSAAQARQVAYEIVWNRKLSPLPTPPRRLEDLYTRPPTNSLLAGNDLVQADQDRKQFEASLSGYYATENATADRLTNFVFAISAAVWANSQSKNPSAVGFDFPVDPTVTVSSGTVKDAEVILIPAGGLTLNFEVPAQYFYALGAGMGTSVDASHRYRLATLEEEQRIITEIRHFIDTGVITAQATTPENAARRLGALGSATAAALAQCPLNADVNALINAWLAFQGADIGSFWTANFNAVAVGHLDLVLCAVTDARFQPSPAFQFQRLIDAIKAIPVNNVHDLEARTTADWNNFFLPNNLTLLPPFTTPGTPAERVAAFIRRLRNFFAVQTAAGPTTPSTGETPPTLNIPVDNPIGQFVSFYNGIHPVPPFAFGGALDQNSFNQALQQVFPVDPAAQAWLAQMLHSIDDLFRMTSGIDPKLQFSLMEALYARGFASIADVQAISEVDFQEALTGTEAYPFASQIYQNAQGSGGPNPPGQSVFSPINPDGSLINCIPPCHLSPLGPVEYLHEMLKTSEASTCDDPAPESAQGNLAVLIASRRGPVGSLQAIAANLDTPLPMIDLVNESLEALASGSASGAIYNTNPSELAGHSLRPAGAKRDHHHSPHKPFLHDPETMFAAIPEHSSPSTPVDRPNGYDLLKSDFSAPTLPYSQPLDVSRSYLRQLGSTRFEVMRTFRKDITEFVLNPALEPAVFQRNRWRYPVRIDIAREYLGISPDEYTLLYTHDIAASPTAGKLLLRTLYGFASDIVNGRNWTSIVVVVPEFLKRTGLSYCEFLELWRSQFLKFSRVGDNPDFPECEPCCPEKLVIQFVQPQDPIQALTQLAVFIRLWRTLRHVRGARYNFTELCDICLVLGLFQGVAINPDFVRQLAAFQMLRDDFRLSLGVRRGPAPGATGADRTAILALWAGTSAPNWEWAVSHLLDQIEDYAEAPKTAESREGKPRRRSAELIKLIRQNLDRISSLAGFNPGTTDIWNARPASTLRFAELLAKIYRSDFTAGEILFLFTVGDHLPGDDPFPEQDANEALESPLGLPEHEEHCLWALRRKLLEVKVSEEEAEKWTWDRIVHSFRAEFGYAPKLKPNKPDALQSLGEHFFPEILERYGGSINPAKRQYRDDLPGSNPTMWNTPPQGPFRYDVTASQLWIQLPLRDESVDEKLGYIGPLSVQEQNAVRELYFSPRADLAPFALMFNNFTEAEHRLIEEGDEHKRWHYFRDEFANFHARCHVIARHLADHVSRVTDRECGDYDLAWALLRRLLADENQGNQPWEQDSGQPPSSNWWELPGGGAFAALLGLTGTGLLGQFTNEKGDVIWNEVRGPMGAFGHDRNEWNSPFPTILPSMGLKLPGNRPRFATLRNGFAIRDTDGKPLGGAEGFHAKWTGALLVEQPGAYEFLAGAPTDPGHEPNFEAAEHHRWRVTLQRGQRTWILLNHRSTGEEAPSAHSRPLSLNRGAYQLTIEFAQHTPSFDDPDDARPQRTGFEVKYRGPDCKEEPEGKEELLTIPLKRLFRDFKENTLAADSLTGTAHDFLALHYSSSLRDIRRTYQRAFKALLFAHRFDLSAKLMLSHSQSEIGFVLDHAQNFLGTAYRLIPGTTPSYQSHHAYFDFNFLPVADPYHAPGQDQRAHPSLERQQALFDWWERIYDYDALRSETRPARERPAWLLFLEASDFVDIPPQLVRHLGIDIQHAPLLLSYYQGYQITSADLEDERWAVRVWHGEKWIRAMLRHFVPAVIGDARPDLWTSDDPGAVLAGESQSGNANLTRFYQDGCFENREPRRYEDVKRLNGGLRERARAALLSYLCRMNRVSLPFGANPFAQDPKDLSDLLLQDVEVDLCGKASRIEEAITAVQTFVERARLGLEPGFIASQSFVFAWDRLFADFRIWQACRRRMIYRENWVEWHELEKARRTEAYRFLESELRRTTLSVAVPGGMEYWTGGRPPEHPTLTVLQRREPSHLRQFNQPENLGLMGTPERDARPSWLAELPGQELLSPPESDPGEDLPLWIQAAVRLGVRFRRIAAASDPPASTRFEPRHVARPPCCNYCGKVHPAVIDEYYFWLVDSRYFEAQTQDADWGATPDDPTSDWERDDKLPDLLHFPSKPVVRLAWCRVHNGEFQTPRRSDEGAHVLEGPGTNPQLQFLGRSGDSLYFSVTDADAPPPGYNDPSPWGFRYDLAPDTAVVLPQVVAPVVASPSYPGGLGAYPFFAYFAPGAPLEPLSLFSPAITVAGVLRAHCRCEAALKWYELYFKPFESDCRWARCEDDQPGNTTDNPCCQTEIVSDEILHQRSILLHYLETLAQFGHAAMCRNSPEGFQKARLIFDSMARILGDRPRIVFSRDDGTNLQTVLDFKARFAPLNPRLMDLYDLVGERLSRLHHCLNKQRLRNGRLHLEMPYWGNSPVRRGWRTEVELCEIEDDRCCPRSPYRFQFLVQKALELAAEVRALGSELLAAFEKGDAEYLAALRARHERQLLNLTLEIRQNEWRESDWQVQALKKTKEGAQARRQYFANLIANGLIGNEQAYVDLTAVGIGTRAAGNIVEAIAQAFHIVPDPYTGAAGFGGTPVAIFKLPVGSKVADALSTAGRILYAVADIVGTTASLSLTEAGWDRREQDWLQQVQVVDIEIEQIQRQILAAERRRDIALRQLNNYQQQKEQSGEIQDFLRDKFTSHALYLFLQQETAAIHHQMYELAVCAARQAQRAFNIERGDTTRRFLVEPLWDSLHEGLLAGERLQLALRQMEKAYLDLNVRRYELSKHISLRLNFPIAFLLLKTTGWCEIELFEWMFDLDYAGQFCRQIKNMSVTIPCVVGPYTGVHCRLTLLSSALRIDPSLLDVESCCTEDEPRNGYEEIPHDPRIVRQYAATEAIATSSGQNDGGIFELNFRDERYLPFEFAGAVSRWRVELPPENNQFDFDSVTDLVLHLNYMAREGGDVLRHAANEIAQSHVPGDGVRFFDMRHDFADAWQVFQGQTADPQRRRTLGLRLGRNMFPFLTGNRRVQVRHLEFFFEAPGAIPSASHVVEFLIGHRPGHAHGEECDCEIRHITCIASADWPALYHGVFDLHIEPLVGNGYRDIGAFRFPRHTGPICRAYLVCSYRAVGEDRLETCGR
jgi:hypothetical protein